MLTMPIKFETPEDCLIRAANMMHFSYQVGLIVNPETAAERAANRFFQTIYASNHATLREDIGGLLGLKAYMICHLKSGYSALLLLQMLVSLDIRDSGRSVTSSNKLNATTASS